ncbi:MAG: hypothetical protein N3E41_08805 [Thermofilaceae archaeon]|nr:hypothetical protein [Thermofilaceae archaeon]
MLSSIQPSPILPFSRTLSILSQLLSSRRVGYFAWRTRSFQFFPSCCIVLISLAVGFAVLPFNSFPVASYFPRNIQIRRETIPRALSILSQLHLNNVQRDDQLSMYYSFNSFPVASP